VTHVPVETATREAAVSIKSASELDIQPIGDTLADAFHDDPVFRWCIPDEARRRAALPAFFGLFATALVPGGEVYTTEGGAALWAPPGRPVVSPDRVEEFYTSMGAISGEDAPRVFAVGKMIDERHPAGDFYYLQFIGVRSGSQGRGIGSTLLREVLDRADREGTPAYLEATSPGNRRLYERHGFVVREEFSPAGCPPLWAMWREPAR
jgi:ribosomal protein S18 acetylase RimI-like enzyme